MKSRFPPSIPEEINHLIYKSVTTDLKKIYKVISHTADNIAPCQSFLVVYLQSLSDPALCPYPSKFYLYFLIWSCHL